MWCASSPHHVTGVFAPHSAPDPARAGSIGAGLAVEPRLVACLGPPAESPPPRVAERAAALLGAPELAGRLRIRTPLPPGKGYAVSAATAAASALAVGASLRRGYREALDIAHEADVLESSGLGDVLAISCGVGLVVRTAPGAPSVGRVECFQVPGTVAILAVDGPPLHTRRMLERMPEDAWALAMRLVERVAEERSIEAFVEAAHEFSRATGMLHWVLGGRDPPRVPGAIGYYAKKSVLVYVVEGDRVGDAASELRRAGLEPRLLEPSRGPPMVWWE